MERAFVIFLGALFYNCHLGLRIVADLRRAEEIVESYCITVDEVVEQEAGVEGGLRRLTLELFDSEDYYYYYYDENEEIRLDSGIFWGLLNELPNKWVFIK